MDSAETIFKKRCLDALNKDISMAEFIRCIRKAKGELGKSGLIEVAREFTKGGRHEGICFFDGPEGACSIHLKTYFKRREDLCRMIGAI